MARKIIGESRIVPASGSGRDGAKQDRAAGAGDARNVRRNPFQCRRTQQGERQTLLRFSSNAAELLRRGVRPASPLAQGLHDRSVVNPAATDNQLADELSAKEIECAADLNAG